MIVAAIQIFLFLAVAWASYVVLHSRNRASNVQRRLNEVEVKQKKGVGGLLKQTSTSNHFLAWVQQKSSLSDGEERRRLAGDLGLAGFASPAAAAIFVVVRFGLAIALPLLILLFGSHAHRASQGTIFFAFAAAGAGFLLPATFVRVVAARRRRELEYEFPNALDLLVVCVEAGLSIDAAFLRVAQEVTHACPRVHTEFQTLSSELRAGKSRADALRSMADRANLPSIRSFVTLLIQSDALGASIAQTLRTIAVEMRQTRLLKAEERAVKMPVLMTIPLVTCILPVIVTALLLPAAIDVFRTLMPTLLHR
jgi:tight adherence protein C